MGTASVKQQPAQGDSDADHPDLTGEHLENGTELGNVQIHQSVIATIARLTAMKIPGVVEMSGGLVDGLAGMIGKKSVDRGIRVEFEENSVTIELHVIMEYGVRIPHVAWKIQTEIRQAVEQMTGKPVKAVQVVVQGVRLPSAGNRPSGEESA